MNEDIKNIRPKQCYFCHIDEGFKCIERIYHYKVQFFGTWDNFYVLPMIGAGLDGYVLIFHKNHYHSLADIPAKDLKSLRKLIDIIKEEISRKYGTSIVFEHGSTCDNISCLIDHAHIHIAPVPKEFDMKNEIELDFELSSMKNYSDLSYWCHGGLGILQYKINDGELDEESAKKRFKSFSGYLYYEDVNGKMFIHEIEDLYCFQPQYLRMVLFKKLEIEKWEWNKNINPECQRRTIENLQGLSKYLTPFKNNGGKK